MILYLDRVESIEHAKFRALAQILLVANSEDQSAGTEAFDAYLQQAFPNAANKKGKKHEQMMEALKEWVSLGPLGVTPMAVPTTKGKSKMVSKITEVVTGEVSAVTGQKGGIRLK